MQLSTTFSCNTVIWISSVPEDELTITHKMSDALKQLSTEQEFHFQRVEIDNKAHLFSILEEISLQAKDFNMRPILHFDMHGNEREGLHISKSHEFVSWAI